MAEISEPLRLAVGDLDVGLVPAIGGSIAWLRWRGIELMRPLSAADTRAGSVLGVACFPMLPYANRIEGNAFAFEGRTFRFEANNPPERLNVHGTGWQRPWTVEAAGPERARIALEVGDGPYAYRAVQEVAVEPAALAVRIAVTNRGDAPAPFGIGLHPWFERDADVELEFRATHFYLEEPENLAGDRIGLPAELDFANGRHLPGRWRNNDYGGWAGRAVIRYPSRGVHLGIVAEPVFGHLMLYADPTKPFFCVEPQSHASGAFNRPGGFSDPAEGVRVLAPGETLAGTVRFEAGYTVVA